MQETHEVILNRLDGASIEYEVMEHAPEGQTEAVSRLRGHPLTQAAKCIMLIAKTGKKKTRFILAVVRGDSRVDTAKIKALFNATYVGFAAADVTKRLAKSELGTVLPFAMDEEVSVVADPMLLAEERIYFNAARLDRSITMKSEHYVEFQNPRVEPIAAKEP